MSLEGDRTCLYCRMPIFVSYSNGVTKWLHDDGRPDAETQCNLFAVPAT